ncbi:hypothetical protein M758_3G181700 [Ceratodon purpureus]|nr:hypothetical protein M758_3G181700 [Ceratodon purpureus]
MDAGRNDYVPVKAKAYPASKNPLSADARFWKAFKILATPQHIGAVTSIQFSPVDHHDFAVSSSTRVTIYDGITGEVKKTISRFTDVAYSGTFRSDGQLLAAGGETGMVQIFDLGSRQILRQLKGHKGAVHWVRYAPQDKLHVLSAGDDRTVRYWDVATSEPLSTLNGHTDYVRCGSASPTSNDLWASGSYDHTVRLWDIRTPKCVLQLEHEKPLEDVLFFPSGGLLASAGGTDVKIWDIVGGGRLVQTLGSHQKTVTSLTMTAPRESSSALEQDAPRLLTSSLDGHVRVFDLSSFKVTHAAKYPHPLVSMGLSTSSQTLAVGTSSGMLYIRQRKATETKEDQEEKPKSLLDTTRSKKPKQLRPNNYRYFLRGRSESAAEGDHVLVKPQKGKLNAQDKFLRKFMYREALSAALATADPTVVIAVMEELVARRGLVKAISNRDAPSLEPLLAFLCKYIVMPKQTRLLVPVAHLVLDLYTESLGVSPTISHLISILRDRVGTEVKLHLHLQSLQGLMEPLIQASAQI